MATITIPWKTKPPTPKPEPVKIEKHETIIVKHKEEPETKPPEAEIPTGISHLCSMCHNPVTNARTDLGLGLCAKCTPQNKPLGIMDFGHKTGGVLMIVNDRKTFKLLKKPINQQR